MMNQQTTIFLTGAGGVAIPFLVKQLQAQGYRVIVGDMNRYATGFYTADKSFIIPAATSPHFLPIIRQICRQENVKIFVPLVDEELEQSFALEADGIIVLLPRRDFVTTCLDKYILTKELECIGVRVPQTFLLSEFSNQMTFPLLIKPRTGRGSRGVSIITSQQEYDQYLNATQYEHDQLLVQEYIDGPEYTVSVVAWRDGMVQAIVPKEIISKKGITNMAVTRRNNPIDQQCWTIQKELHADGPFNVQLRIDKTGTPCVFEINPRFSTSITLTTAAGVDELSLIIACALGIRTAALIVDWQEGLVLVRQTVDTFYHDQEFVQQQNKITRCEL